MRENLGITKRRDKNLFSDVWSLHRFMCARLRRMCEREAKKQGDKTKKIMSNEGGSQWIKDHELDFEKWLTFPPEDTKCECKWIFKLP